MVDVSSIGGLGEQIPQEDPRSRKKPQKSVPQESSSFSSEEQSPVFDPMLRVRDISEQIHQLQEKLLDSTLDDEKKRLVQMEIQAHQVALENLLSVSLQDFDPFASLEKLNEKMKAGQVRPHPGAMGRLLRDRDS
jgi:hypothetical protein